MAKITFRGQKYNSLADMPAKVRHDYLKAQAGYEVPEEPKDKPSRMPVGIENMSDEVRGIYERALNKVDAKPLDTRQINELPKAESLYRKSAPPDMQNRSSDEVVYQPSAPIIESPSPVIEPDHMMRRLVIALAVGAILLGIFLVFYFGF
jgi:hypothetical protein